MLVLAESKTQKCQLELRMLRWTRSWPIQKFICITVSVNPEALKLKEAVTPPGVLNKEGVLKNFSKLTVKHLCRSLFFNNFIFKKDSDKAFFLSVLLNFWEHFFYRTVLDDCFWIGFMVKKFNSMSLIFLNS